MRSELYLLSGAAVGMAAAVILIFAQSDEVDASSASGAVETFTAELARSETVPVEHAMAPAARVNVKSSAGERVEREVRVILPSPYDGVSVSGVR